MEYDDIMQQTLDIDWFMLDKLGYIAHMASGGGALPDSVAASVEDNKILQNYFGALKEDHEIAVTKVGYFIDSFIEMGSKGLYSFDVLKPGVLSSTTYLKIVSPIEPLHIDSLPTDVRDILLRTRVDIVFASTNEFEWQSVLSNKNY
jgi:hypothetical protein